MERKSYLGSIIKYKQVGDGAFSNVYKCDYFDALYAYKEYMNPDYVKFISEKIKRISQYYYEETSLVFPYTFIYRHLNDKYFCGYVMDYLNDYKKMIFLENLDYDNKILLLKKCRALLDKLHNKYNFIHTDICPWNFLYNESKNDIKLIDFDSCIDLNNKEKYLCDFYSIFAQDYGNTVGVDKDLDIFLFNLMTYSILTDSDYNISLENICNNKLNYFENENIRKIFESYKDLNCNKSLKKEYVIDYL